MDISNIRLGNPTSKNGAVYICTDRDSHIRMLVDIYQSALQFSGIMLTPEIKQEILLFVKNRQDSYDKYIDSLGIPEYLKTIFTFFKKSKLESYCKRITISEDDLSLLMHNSSQIGFKYRSKFTEFVPEERKILNSDLSEMYQGNPKPFVKKFKAIIQERKRFHVHLFEKEKEWHCFYFTFKDLESGDNQQWKMGSHLHYISYLWANLRKRQVWDSFDERDIDIQGIHIKLKPSVMDAQSINEQIKSDANHLISRFKDRL